MKKKSQGEPPMSAHCSAIFLRAEGQEVLILLNFPPWYGRGEPSEDDTKELISEKERAEMG